MYQIYPICLKISTSDFARILPKSRMRFFVAAWIFTTGGTVLRAYRQSWQTKPQQFPKENSGEGDILSPAVYYKFPKEFEMKEGISHEHHYRHRPRLLRHQNSALFISGWTYQLRRTRTLRLLIFHYLSVSYSRFKRQISDKPQVTVL